MVGALALALTDAMLHEAQAQAPEPGPAAAALALLGHDPGMPIERLRRSLRLSHPGAVRLVDRLVDNGQVVREPSPLDRRAVALRLTPAGEATCQAVISARDTAITRALAALTARERQTFGDLAEKVLRRFVVDLDHAYTVCRLCAYEACTECPVDQELDEREREAVVGV
ncbi:MarR family winged helix-turn-helix transcriptional regulator [Methylobacterium trifolii]|uniref:MarR family winged helix-turn-helix transcriptional regulator n=1 Tax=Methylobacterium trifolii TaxID=1003092 RepID=UPI001EE0392B|nr:MarR family transcriptional regulator [Methylobacterium trifolii]